MQKARETASGPAVAQDRVSLPRNLGVLQHVLIIVAFNAPIAGVAGFLQLSIGLGNGIGAPLSFIVAGLILFAFAIGFINMSRSLDNTGSFHRLILVGIGRPAGIAGAFLATAAYVIITVGSYVYMGVVTIDIVTRLSGSGLMPWQAWSLLTLLLITGLGLLRTDLSMRFMGKIVIAQIAMVLIWQTAVFVQGGPEGYSLSTFTVQSFLQGSPGIGILFAILCMIGIEGGACYSAEARDPERSVGRATYLAIVIMVILYTCSTWAYIITQGASQAVASATADPVGSFFGSVSTYLGALSTNVFSGLLLVSQLVAISVIQGSASRYIFALATDGVFPAFFARIHPRLESPFVAVLTVSVISLASILAISIANFSPVVAFAALTGMGTYFLILLLISTSLAIIFYNVRHGRARNNVGAALIAPGIAAAGFVTVFGLVSLNLTMIVGTPLIAQLSLVAIVIAPLTGFVTALRLRRRDPATYTAMGNW